MPWYEVIMLNVIQYTLLANAELALPQLIASMSPSVLLAAAVIYLVRKCDRLEEQNDKLQKDWRESDKEIYKSLGGNVADWPEK